MSKGRFSIFGGQYAPETMMSALDELEAAYQHYQSDPQFRAELAELLKTYAGRPSLLYEAKKMSADLGGAKIYLKREDLNHTGSHKINNVLGQVLLAKKMGKKRVIAETGAGQHGVATATAAALMDMECEVFMGAEDIERQALNVFRMKLLGAKVHAVHSGTGALKDAVNETMREWVSRIQDTHYVLGSVMGPHPFPTIVRDFQKIIGEEIKAQMLAAEGKLPDVVIACVGGGSNAMGAFYDFIEEPSVRLIGCEAAGRGVNTAETAATDATTAADETAAGETATDETTAADDSAAATDETAADDGTWLGEESLNYAPDVYAPLDDPDTSLTVQPALGLTADDADDMLAEASYTEDTEAVVGEIDGKRRGGQEHRSRLRRRVLPLLLHLRRQLLPLRHRPVPRGGCRGPRRAHGGDGRLHRLRGVNNLYPLRNGNASRSVFSSEVR